MIKDPEGWARWEAAQRAAAPLDYAARLRWYDEMLTHARALGVWPPADPMEGLAEKIEWWCRLQQMGKPKRNDGQPVGPDRDEA